VGTVRIIYGVATISHQAAVHPKYTLGALNMEEEDEEEEEEEEEKKNQNFGVLSTLTTFNCLTMTKPPEYM